MIITPFFLIISKSLPDSNSHRRKVAGDGVHPAGIDHEAQEDHEDAARLDRVTHDVPVFLEQCEHFRGEETHRKKRQHKPERIHPDQKEATRRRAGA